MQQNLFLLSKETLNFLWIQRKLLIKELKKKINQSEDNRLVEDKIE